MRLAVVGTGYVGLATAVAMAYLGNEVTCIDTDEEKVRALQEGRIPFHEPYLDKLLTLVRPRTTFTTRYEGGVSQAEIIFITVGTPPGPDGAPDLSQVTAAARQIGGHLEDSYRVVAVKSTVPVGSGNWVKNLIREACTARNGSGSDIAFDVASTPEFLREGSALQDTLYPDRVVIGADDLRALAALQELYRPILEQSFPAPPGIPRPEGVVKVPLLATDLASAEMIKYAANAFLALKISYINEIAGLCERVGADVTEVAAGIGLDKRIGPHFLEAGAGWGGSCFGKDTRALMAMACEQGYNMPILEAAVEVNYRQRERVVEKLEEHLGDLRGRTVGILGLSFKPNTDDLRDSPALDIARKLLERGARVRAHDPVAIPRARREYPHLPITYCQGVEELAHGADALMLVTEWEEYRKLPLKLLAERVRTPIFMNARNGLSPETVRAAGFTYLGVGRPCVSSLPGERDSSAATL